MLPLRFPWVWALLGWTLVALVCVGSLLPGESVPSIGVSDKLLHSGTYFVLMIWFAGLYPRSKHVWIAFGLIALGAILDVLQGMTPSRQLDPLDIASNAAGVLAALALSFWLLEGWCQRIEGWLVPSST